MAELPGAAVFSVLAALPEELGPLAERRVRSFRALGLEILEVDLGPGTGGAVRALACAGGVGKVNAASAAAALLVHGGTRGLLVVGVCGGLRRRLGVGTLVHCERAIEADLALRGEREVASDPELLERWRALAPGACGAFLTADRPVLSPWRRLRLARAFAGDCVADMETSAAGRVARRAGVPWAALRAVTDGAGAAGLLEFRKNFAVQAGRAAATLPALVQSLLAARPAGERARDGRRDPADEGRALAPPGRPQ